MASKIRLEMQTYDDHIRVCHKKSLLRFVNVIGIQGKEKPLNMVIRNKRGTK